MAQSNKTREFIIGYWNALATAPRKSRAWAERYTADESLIQHILFFEGVFPGYRLFADEMVAEGNKVFIRGRCKGRHEGEFNGIPPTHREVDFPFAIGYEVENDKIIRHWLIADQAILLEQLGIISVPA